MRFDVRSITGKANILEEIMIPVEEALRRMLTHIRPLEAEVKPILDCLGQVVQVDIESPIDVPPMDNSAMDGFAVRAEDLKGAHAVTPVALQVIDRVAAGAVSSCIVESGDAIRIMTGAAVPAGADTVVPFEDTDETSRSGLDDGLKTIGILVEAKQGANVRRRGEDIHRGQLAIRRGTVLRPSEIGILAAMGIPEVSVIRRPIVAILSTGDELVPIDRPLTSGKIHDANSYSVAALTSRYGGIARIVGIGRDSTQLLNQMLDGALDCDLLITSGGVSFGDYDMVKDVLAARGKMDLWTICMKPGKPSAFGIIRRGNNKSEIPHLGLPGNPVSSMVSFEQFARPIILKMLGQEVLEKPSVWAMLEDRITNNDMRRIYARVQVRRAPSGLKARLTGPQGSAILTSMAKANGLAIVPESCPVANPGDVVEVQMLDWPESCIVPEVTP
jgi:molybdopterin molybdotransferase